MDMSKTTVTMSDSKGKLLFYTNGCEVYNAENELMENGAEIGLGGAYDIFCRGSETAYRREQYMIVLPYDNGDSLFYLIQQREFDYQNNLDIRRTGADALQYSIIDMRKNGGKGKIIQKNHVFYKSDTLQLTGLTAVKQNETDWWIIVSNIKNEKLIFRFTNGGVVFNKVQSIGVVPYDFTIHQSVFSPQGDKYAIYDSKAGLRIFDFNRNTGELSNFTHIPPIDDTFAWGGCAFSPNGKLIYISHHYKCFQYNLEVEDIAASVKLVGQWDGYLNEERYTPSFGQMQLAPDCRIYISVAGGRDDWHIIHNPNEIGLACNLEMHIPLPWVNGGAVGNFPNYRLGNEPVCDSTLIGLSGFVPPDLPDRRVSVTSKPNEWKINMYLPDREKGSWILKDMYGHIVEEKKVKSSGGLITDEIDLNGYPSGIYYWEYYSESGKLITGKVLK